MEITKLDAARIQLDAAIEHFFNEDHVCAVALAGAADEILGQLLEASGQESSFAFLHQWYEANHGPIKPQEFSRQWLNRARNWLKHASDDLDSQLDISHMDSLMKIMLAIRSYTNLTGTETEAMASFDIWYRRNIEEINRWFVEAG